MGCFVGVWDALLCCLSCGVELCQGRAVAMTKAESQGRLCSASVLHGITHNSQCSYNDFHRARPCAHRGLLDAVGDAGVVEAAASALQRLALLPGQLPEQQAQQAQQQHAVQGLKVLHCVCYDHEANLQRLVAAGGLPSVASGVCSPWNVQAELY